MRRLPPRPATACRKAGDSLAAHFPEQATWTRPQGGLFVWATLPEYIDTGDLLAKALRQNVAFVPGSAAYTDGRGTNSMRLNFSGVTVEEIREGVMRIGEVIAEQVALYETLTQEKLPSASSASRPGADGSAEDGGTVLPMRRRGQ